MKVEVRPYWIYRDLCLSIMGKDSYWFRHDSNAGRGLKMRKMAHIYGHWGKGIYWDVVEILRDQENYRFQSDESSLQLLCDLVGCKDEKRFLNWFNDSLRIGLFIKEETYFICPPLVENMEVWETKKNNGSKGGRPPKKTELKPNTKPNQKHNRTEQNITINTYNELMFKSDWNSLRTEITKKPSHLNILSYDEKDLLQVLVSELENPKEDIEKALRGFFKQSNYVNGADFSLNVKHFLSNFNKYYQAYFDKNSKVWGTNE